MREALDDTDDDDVIGRTASLYLSDDYKEVKDRVVLAWFSSRAVPFRQRDSFGRLAWNVFHLSVSDANLVKFLHCFGN